LPSCNAPFRSGEVSARCSNAAHRSIGARFPHAQKVVAAAAVGAPPIAPGDNVSP
jgi:hypothetical protein